MKIKISFGIQKKIFYKNSNNDVILTLCNVSGFGFIKSHLVLAMEFGENFIAGDEFSRIYPV
jgi:hypothetical protein